MENDVVQLVRPPIKHDERYIQVFVIDGCTVKASFLPESTQNDNKPTLNNIKSALLAQACTK